MTLTEIANKYNCDKGTKAYEAHGYTEEYAKYIPQEGKYTLLEIGVWHGDSLRMWKEYNPELEIYGMDIDPNADRYMSIGDPITLIGDATDAEFLNMVLGISGTPDFVIDDGSHRHEDISASFKYLYPKLKERGYYFIEDLHAPQATREDLLFEIGRLFPNAPPLPFELKCNAKLLIIQK